MRLRQREGPTCITRRSTPGRTARSVSALSQMKVVLDLDRRAPDASSPDDDRHVPEFLRQGPLRARRHQQRLRRGPPATWRSGHSRRRSRTCQAVSREVSRPRAVSSVEVRHRRAAAPAALGLHRATSTGAWRSSPISEPSVHIVREALAEYPGEDHFVRAAARLLRGQARPGELDRRAIARPRRRRPDRRGDQRPRHPADDLRRLSGSDVRTGAPPETARTAGARHDTGHVGPAD